MDYKKEYGRYKKKVEDQQKEIARLHEEVQGMTQVLKANDAIIAAILVAAGADRHAPLMVTQKRINEALKGEYRIVSEIDPETKVYTIFHEPPMEVTE